MPELFWVEGLFGAVRHSLYSGEQPMAQECSLHWRPNIADTKNAIQLITNDQYFASGYDQISSHPVTAGNFGISAKLLLRMLFLDLATPVAAPVVIIKIDNSVK